MRPQGIVSAIDQNWLTVADSVGRYTWSFRIERDGKLSAKQPSGWLQLPDDPARSDAYGMTTDVNGNLYVCTAVGLQVLDTAGRLNLILNKPQPGPLLNVAFCGLDLNTLYVTSGDKVFKRKLKTKGALPFQSPIAHR